MLLQAQCDARCTFELSLVEENVMHYAAGYVTRKLLQKLRVATDKYSHIYVR